MKQRIFWLLLASVGMSIDAAHVSQHESILCSTVSFLLLCCVMRLHTCTLCVTSFMQLIAGVFIFYFVLLVLPFQNGFRVTKIFVDRQKKKTNFNSNKQHNSLCFFFFISGLLVRSRHSILEAADKI